MSDHPHGLPPDALTTRRESTIVSTPRWSYSHRWLLGVVTLLTTVATALDLGLVERFERQVQTFYFEVRGPVPAPDNIVILAIDEESLRQQEFYQADPKRYAYLEGLQSWPWQRTTYAIAIEKILGAGARAIAVDVVFASPSSYGPEDDQRLATALALYPEQIVLAAQFTQVESPQGLLTQLVSPIPPLTQTATRIGAINFYLEPNGRIHRLGNQFLSELIQSSPSQQGALYRELFAQTPTFAEATLRAAREGFQPPEGEALFFYGPPKSFTHIPFWYVLDPDTWNNYLQGGEFFEDKIVLIGSTAAVHQDLHYTPFGKSIFYPDPMPGVEIHANAIASLMNGLTLRELLPIAPFRGLVVGLVVLGMGWLISRRRLFSGVGLAAAGAIAWWIASYICFVQARLIVPTATPIAAIVLLGGGHLVLGTLEEQARKRQLRATLKQYSSSPIVQKIISQQEDLRDLLQERERELSGKVLGGRYQIINVLGSGGFSETYTARDMQRPGQPMCVVKQLRVKTDNLKTIDLARRLFVTEAEMLEKLGQHPQIPQLMAFFEEDGDFYLIQELIPGVSLSTEFRQNNSRSVNYTLNLLLDLLHILNYVHTHGVIHRDLKPSNIIRRSLDQRLVLIDFGVSKAISNQLAEADSQTRFTVAVGTPGYMPSEQSAGRPRFNSDLYALGIIALEALTGQSPRRFFHDPKTGQILWRYRVPEVSTELANLLDKMTHHDYTQRCQSAVEVYQAITALPEYSEMKTLVDVGQGAAPETGAEEIYLGETDPTDLGDRLPDASQSETTFATSDTIACDLNTLEQHLDSLDQETTIILKTDSVDSTIVPEA